jgi:hypothetical protein
MNRSKYFEYIEEKLIMLATRITLRGRLNMLNLNIHSENFYSHFLNELYGWTLGNHNETDQNLEAIDLKCDTKMYVVQVSSTNTKQKVESALEKDSISQYHKDGYSFKFISIAKEATELRKQQFKNPHGIDFDPLEDIIDLKTILASVLTAKIEKQKSVYDLLQKELGDREDIVKLDTNLALVINILAKVNLTTTPADIVVNSFEISKKIDYNKLQGRARDRIEDYKANYTQLELKYNECDQLAVNKSFSVYQAIKALYYAACEKYQDPNDVFFAVIEGVKDIVNSSANYQPIPVEELDICANIIVVDAFIRCKIFKSPNDYNHVAPR